jgi:hypothetical protein
VTQPVQNKPSGFLGNVQVFGQLSGCDAFGMARHHPNRYEPLPQRQFGILEDGPDFDRKPLAAIATFMCPVVREVINLGAATVWAIGTIFPADRPKVIDADLLVCKGFHHLHQAVELLDHCRTLSMQQNYPTRRLGSSTYISAKKW